MRECCTIASAEGELMSEGKVGDEVAGNRAAVVLRIVDILLADILAVDRYCRGLQRVAANRSEWFEAYAEHTNNGRGHQHSCLSEVHFPLDRLPVSVIHGLTARVIELERLFVVHDLVHAESSIS